MMFIPKPLSKLDLPIIFILCFLCSCQNGNQIISLSKAPEFCQNKIIINEHILADQEKWWLNFTNKDLQSAIIQSLNSSYSPKKVAAAMKFKQRIDNEQISVLPKIGNDSPIMQDLVDNEDLIYDFQLNSWQDILLENLSSNCYQSSDFDRKALAYSVAGQIIKLRISFSNLMVQMKLQKDIIESYRRSLQSMESGKISTNFYDAVEFYKVRKNLADAKDDLKELQLRSRFTFKKLAFFDKSLLIKNAADFILGRDLPLISNSLPLKLMDSRPDLQFSDLAILLQDQTSRMSNLYSGLKINAYSEEWVIDNLSEKIEKKLANSLPKKLDVNDEIDDYLQVISMALQEVSGILTENEYLSSRLREVKKVIIAQESGIKSQKSSINKVKGSLSSSRSLSKNEKRHKRNLTKNSEVNDNIALLKNKQSLFNIYRQQWINLVDLNLALGVVIPDNLPIKKVKNVEKTKKPSTQANSIRFKSLAKKKDKSNKVEKQNFIQKTIKKFNLKSK